MILATIARSDRFGHLVIVRQSRGSDHGRRYRVKCACGRRLWAKASKLKSGEAQDCGRCAEQLCKDS